jgi:hypothetical protein
LRDRAIDVIFEVFTVVAKKDDVFWGVALTSS